MRTSSGPSTNPDPATAPGVRQPVQPRHRAGDWAHACQRDGVGPFTNK